MSQTRNGKFWTAGRSASAAAVFLASALVISSCTADDTARDAAQKGAPQEAGKPEVTVTAQRGAQPPQAASDTLSQAVLGTAIQALDGGSFRLADYKDKIVVLDIWATWCGPCRKEVPHLVDIQRDYGAKGVEVVGLTIENPATDEGKVLDFAREFDINYKVGWARSDLAMALMRGNGSIPQTFVIVPGGRVVAHYRGYSDAVPQMIRAAIDKARAGQASGD